MILETGDISFSSTHGPFTLFQVITEILTNSAEVSLPAWTAAALAGGGVVAVSTEPGAI